MLLILPLIVKIPKEFFLIFAKIPLFTLIFAFFSILSRCCGCMALWRSGVVVDQNATKPKHHNTITP